MPTTNFSFPGVTLEQIFENRITGTNATLGTVCIGQAYRIHSHANDYKSTAIDTTAWTLAAPFTTALPDRALIPGTSPIDASDAYQEVYIVDGAWKYAELDPSDTTLTGTYSEADTVKKVTFNKILKASEDHPLDPTFNGREVRVGDKVVLTAIVGQEDPQTVTVTAEVLSVIESVQGAGYNTITVDQVPDGVSASDEMDAKFSLGPQIILGSDNLNKIEIKGTILKNSTGHVLSDIFNGRNVQEGDKLRLMVAGGTSKVIATVMTVIESVKGEGYDTIVVDALPEGAESGDFLDVEFAVVANEVYGRSSGKFTINNPNKTGEILEISAVLTKDLALIFGATTTIDGTLIYVPKIYFDYREKNPSLANTLNSAATPSEAVAILGPAVPENPLSMAVQFAILAAGGINVYFVGVRTDDKDGYLEAFDYLNSFNYVYNVVPATSDATIIKALAGVVYSVSTNIDSKVRRTLWYGINTPNPVVLATGSAVISNASEATQKKVTFAANVFITAPFQEGDGVSITSTVNGVKVTKIYEILDTNFVNIATVDNEDNSLGNGTFTVSLVRTMATATQLVDAIIAERVTNDFRSQCVWADDAMYDGNVVENYCLAAAAAGMRSAEQPWRPLSNLTYSFFSVAESHGFTKSQLERLGANGIWIVGNNDNGVPINKKAITTAMSNDINTESESIVANADEIALVLCRVGEDLVGSSNISPTLLTLLHDSIDSILAARCINGTSAYVGSQLLSYSITNVWQDTVNLDEVYADVECEPPKPFNKFHITMRII